MRPADLEGTGNRLQFLDQTLGILPDQVLSPRLSQGNYVTVIKPGAELVYDKEKQRLQPADNDGLADGWIIKGGELPDFLASEAALADCPLVSIDFMDPNDGSKLASAGLHTGWQNLKNGIDLTFAKAVEAEGLSHAMPMITVGPGARSLDLPDRVLQGTSRDVELGGSSLMSYADGAEVVEVKDKEGNKQDGRIVDTVELTGRLFAEALGVDYDAAIKNGQIILSDIDTLIDLDIHSYRRDGHWNPDSTTAEQYPEARRFLSVMQPYMASAYDSVRGELFGDAPRGIDGMLSLQEETANTKVYLVT
jgi:hypothetical protein